MVQELGRLVITVLATLLLARQATQAAQRSWRRRAFSFGAVGFGLLAFGNLLALLGFVAPLMLLVSLGVALLLVSLASLFLAYRAGELRDQLRRAGDMVAQEREAREGRERERLERERLERERLEREGREG